MSKFYCSNPSCLKRCSPYVKFCARCALLRSKQGESAAARRRVVSNDVAEMLKGTVPIGLEDWKPMGAEFR
jgi:hypothetical protein